MCVCGKMIVRGAVPFGFLVEIPVFEVKTDGHADVGTGGQLLSGGAFFRGPAELKGDGIFFREHFRA